MKILSAGERMAVRDFVGYVLWGKQHTLASKRMIAHNIRVSHKTGLQCYHRNDWVTYRAMEVDNFLAGKIKEEK
jgi:hypothetical protein